MANKGKSFDELRFTDDFMFSEVMQNKNICTEVLNLILKAHIGEIVDIKYQKSFRDGDAKELRFDIVATTKSGEVYEIEMQNRKKRDMQKRARLYQSSLDMGKSKKGQDYGKLPKTIVIFLCTFDLFGKGLPFYTFKNFCEEDKNIEFADDRMIIIVNSKAFAKAKDPDEEAFLAFLDGKERNSDLVTMIKNEVIKVKQDNEARENYARYSLALMDAREKAREEAWSKGTTKGRVEGIQQKALETARNAKMIGYQPHKLPKSQGFLLMRLQKFKMREQKR